MKRLLKTGLKRIEISHRFSDYTDSIDYIPAIPPADYKGSQADWMIALEMRGYWNSAQDLWYGDVAIPAEVWWEILEECENSS